MSDVMSRLRDRDQVYQSVPDRGYDDLPDGKYTGVVESMAIEEAKASGRLQVKTTIEVKGPTHAGRLQWHYRGLEDTKDLEFLKGDLKRWGYDLTSLTELPGVCDDMPGKELEFTLRTGSDGKQRLYLGKVLQEATS